MKQGLTLVALLCGALFVLAAPPSKWVLISSATGELPVPDAAAEPTAALILDIDNDQRLDFVIGARNEPPAVVWYRRTASGWTKHVIDGSAGRIEAGGAFADIDRDGDLDIAFGGDARSNEIWWWENPRPAFGSTWMRHTIKKSGARKHHDQAFADLDGDGRPELISWNQGAKQLLVFRIPPDARAAEEWPSAVIYSWNAGEEHEGLAIADVNGDRRLDIVGGGRWFENKGGLAFEEHVIDESYRFSRAAAGRFKGGRWLQVVFGSGDNVKPLKLFEYDGKQWSGRALLPGDVDHGHSLAAADINGDGRLDIFCGEMAQWGPRSKPPDNPGARIWVLYGDGKGTFTTEVVHEGQGIHEGKLGDLDGDGRLDILGKPFRHNTPRLDIYLNRGAVNAGERK